MGIITGYICLILFILLILKFVTQRCHLRKANIFLMRIHKYVAFGFLAMSIIHLMLVFNVLDTRHFIITISGIGMIVFSIILIVVCHTIKVKRVEIKFHRFFSFVISVMLILHVVFYFIDYTRYKNAINNITIEKVNLDNISDGDYIGEYDVGYIYAKVKVTVKDHTITSIEILQHDNERGKKAEVITENIVAEQKIDVDAISGASNSSMVIKRACIDALTK